MSASNDITIHSCIGSPDWAEVHRKIGLYASEVVCTVISGKFGQIGTPPAARRAASKVSALELASMLCEALEVRERGELS